MKMNNIFDSHAHYSDFSFNNDRDELLAGLQSKGVKYIILASYDIESTLKNDEICRKYDYIYSASGIHPESVDEIPENYLEILENTVKSNPKIKAVGEIGLDYHYENYDRERQIEIFKEQLELAKKLELPVIIHSRDATEDTMKILREYQPKGVLHCFSGSAETAKEAVKLGLYVSFTGVLTFKNARKALEALAVIPNDRLMLETDCPYMAPVPFRGKRCDSSMIPYIAEKAGEIKGMTAQEILNLTCENGVRFFGL